MVHGWLLGWLISFASGLGKCPKRFHINHPTIGDIQQIQSPTDTSDTWKSPKYSMFSVGKTPFIYPIFCPISISDVIWYSKSPSHGTLTHWPSPVVYWALWAQRELLGVLADTLDIASREKLLGLRVFFPGKQMGSSWFLLFLFFLLGNVGFEATQLWLHQPNSRSSPTKLWNLE